MRVVVQRSIQVHRSEHREDFPTSRDFVPFIYLFILHFAFKKRENCSKIFLSSLYGTFVVHVMENLSMHKPHNVAESQGLTYDLNPEEMNSQSIIGM